MPLDVSIGSALPLVQMKLYLQGTTVLDLTGATSVKVLLRKKAAGSPSHEVDATVVSPATAGTIVIENPGKFITEPGLWIAMALVVFPGALPMQVPANSDNALEILADLQGDEASEIEVFRTPVRVLIGDTDAVDPMISDRALDDGIRTAIQMGMVEGYALTATRNAITPAVTTTTAFALVALETARLFVAGRPDRQSVRTRVASESVGSYAQLLRTLETKLSELRGGTAPVASWQSLYCFMVGTQGLPDIAMFSTVKVEQSLKEFSVYARSSAI